MPSSTSRSPIRCARRRRAGLHLGDRPGRADSLRSIIGKSDLDDLLSNRERLNQGLELMIDSPALGWGVHIDRVEIKDVALPESMKRSMSRQAEAERERRARVITADGELQASEKLAQAAEVMVAYPAAMQLRLLETVVEVASEKNSTLVLPFPVELLRFLEKATHNQGPQHSRHDGRRTGRASQRRDTGSGHPADPQRPSQSAPRNRCGPAPPAQSIASDWPTPRRGVRPRRGDHKKWRPAMAAPTMKREPISPRGQRAQRKR